MVKPIPGGLSESEFSVLVMVHYGQGFALNAPRMACLYRSEDVETAKDLIVRGFLKRVNPKSREFRVKLTTKGGVEILIAGCLAVLDMIQVEQLPITVYQATALAEALADSVFASTIQMALDGKDVNDG